MSHLILAATTSAAQSGQIEVSHRENQWAAFSCVPILGSGETAAVQKLHGGTWVNTGAALSSTSNNVEEHAPGIYRVDKGATASPTAVYVSTITDA